MRKVKNIKEMIIITVKKARQERNNFEEVRVYQASRPSQRITQPQSQPQPLALSHRGHSGKGPFFHWSSLPKPLGQENAGTGHGPEKGHEMQVCHRLHHLKNRPRHCISQCVCERETSGGQQNLISRLIKQLHLTPFRNLVLVMDRGQIGVIKNPPAVVDNAVGQFDLLVVHVKNLGVETRVQHDVLLEGISGSTEIVRLEYAIATLFQRDRVPPSWRIIGLPVRAKNTKSKATSLRPSFKAYPIGIRYE